jgi:transcriptional regulator with XRE-family HTH domain
LIDKKKDELIEELKALRIEKGITYQEIADKTEENGEAVSLSTIKLVFSDKHNHDHDYNKILRPIANVLSPSSDEDTLELKVLQTRLELKEEMLLRSQQQLESKEQKHKDREQFYMDLIDFLQDQIRSKDEQIKFKDEQIKHHNEAIDRKDKTIKELYSIIIGTKSAKEVFV